MVLIRTDRLDPDPSDPYLSWPSVDTAGRFRGAASILGLAGINRHADAPVTAVALVAGAQVLVWTSVNAGGVGVADRPKTWVHGCRADGQGGDTFQLLLSRSSQPNVFQIFSVIHDIFFT